MKRRLFLLASASLLTGCSSISVSQDYDVEFDFASLNTFAWKYAEQPETGNPRIDNDLMDRRVRSAVNAALARKGFRLVEAAEADFLVAYFIDYKQRIQGSSWNAGAGTGSYNRYGGVAYDTGIEDYEEGQLTIDLINPATDKNVWRGVGRRRSYETSNPEKVTKMVNSAVSKILKKFPPKT